MKGKRRHLLRRFTARLRYMLTHIKQEDVRVFLYCVAGASLLWVFNSLSKPHTETISYPIEFQYDREQYLEIKPLPNTINLTVKGSGWQIIRKIFRIRIKPIQYMLTVPFFNNKPYLLGSQLRTQITNVLKDVTLIHIATDTIHVVMDNNYSKILSLEVDSAKISLANEYRIISPIRVEPERIAANGPEKQLKKLPQTFFLNLKETSINTNYQQNIPIQIPHNENKLIQLDENYATVSFQVARFSKITSKIFIQKENFPQKSKLNLPDKQREIEITYVFRVGTANDIQLNDFKIVADYNTFNKADSTVALTLKSKPKSIQTKDIQFPNRIKLKYVK